MGERCTVSLARKLLLLLLLFIRITLVTVAVYYNIMRIVHRQDVYVCYYSTITMGTIPESTITINSWVTERQRSNVYPFSRIVFSACLQNKVCRWLWLLPAAWTRPELILYSIKIVYFSFFYVVWSKPSRLRHRSSFE